MADDHALFLQPNLTTTHARAMVFFFPGWKKPVVFPYTEHGQARAPYGFFTLRLCTETNTDEVLLPS